MVSVTLLIGRFKGGSSSAFRELFCQFLPRTSHLAGRQSCNQGSAFQDGEDIAQCVFWELYSAVRHQKPLVAHFYDTPTLLTTLAMLTRQHLRRRWRDGTRLCRDVRLVRTATDLPTAAGTNPLDRFVNDKSLRWLHEIQSRETIEQLLALLPEVRYGDVVRLLLQGHSVPEIAHESRRSVRAIQRYLVEIRSIWQNHPEGREILAAHVLPR